MKSNKVKLMRQIKEENAKFLTWKKEKEREVKQLKEKVFYIFVWLGQFYFRYVNETV